MHNNFQIITDSSCDLPQSLADELGLLVVPLHVTVSGSQYLNYLDGRDIAFPEFYQKIREGAETSTSAANVGEFLQTMESVLQTGTDILFIGFSSGLSTTYQSGCIAAEELRLRYPERNIVTVDSLSASLGFGLLVYLTAQKRKEGLSLEETAEFCRQTIPHLCHWFTIDDLKHLRRGGRISDAAAAIGTVLHIKPVMHMDDTGHLIPVSKVKGRKSALRALAQKAVDTSEDLPSQTVFICHGDCEEDAEYVADCIREKSSFMDVIINYVGPVIGSHTGPGVVSVFFLGSER